MIDRVRIILFRDSGKWVAQVLEHDMVSSGEDMWDCLNAAQFLLNMELEALFRDNLAGNPGKWRNPMPAPEAYHKMWIAGHPLDQSKCPRFRIHSINPIEQKYILAECRVRDKDMHEVRPIGVHIDPPTEEDIRKRVMRIQMPTQAELDNLVRNSVRSQFDQSMKNGDPLFLKSLHNIVKNVVDEYMKDGKVVSKEDLEKMKRDLSGRLMPVKLR